MTTVAERFEDDPATPALADQWWHNLTDTERIDLWRNTASYDDAMDDWLDAGREHARRLRGVG